MDSENCMRTILKQSTEAKCCKNNYLVYLVKKRDAIFKEEVNEISFL